MPARGTSIHTIIYQMGSADSAQVLCAQVLEFNIGAQAPTLRQLYRRLYRAIVGHIAVRRAHGMEPYADLPPVPEKYWEMYKRSKVPLPLQVIRVPSERAKAKISVEMKVAPLREDAVAVGR